MRTICAMTANRADFSRIETILEALQKRSDVELSLVVLGSHIMEQTGKTIEEIERKGFSITEVVKSGRTGDTPADMAASVGSYIAELTKVLERLSPDIALVPVDRFESLAMGTAAALMNICVAHIQGGEVTGTVDESIRHALTKLSHLHFVSTEECRKRVIKMGEPKQFVFNVGCAGTDLLLRVTPLSREATLQALNEGVAETEKLDPKKPYLLFLQHPVTTEFGESAAQITETLEALSGFDEQLVVLWPNIDAGSDAVSRALKKYQTSSKRPFVIFKNIPSGLYANVLRNASAMVGNSSSGIREACYFGTPVVNVGSRQNRRERGHNVTDASYDRSAISKAVSNQLAHGTYKREDVYGDGKSGERVAELLATAPLPPIQKVITY
ncbi:MAG: UDP-N-acetylglucosamine 2-epimerase [Parcubacteria group bacterium GW2011_GWA2_49_9]|nr:MAG: UDP-N-acetylglucosamine 2-epimerase [Parcubacteria group bacterium GW2011_GWA2_49_9]